MPSNFVEALEVLHVEWHFTVLGYVFYVKEMYTQNENFVINNSPSCQNP